MSATDIHAFPLEVYERIFHFLDPASHLDFALADKHLYFYSYGTLKHHEECHKLYHPCLELTEDTLPGLLRTIATDHIAAWHVRTVEGLDRSRGYQTELMDEAPLRALESLIQAKMISSRMPVFGIRQMRNGYQEALQLALIALCPRLHTLKSRSFFRNFGYLHEDTEEAKDLFQHYTVHGSHNYFCNFIRAIHETVPEPIWPPGFRSLRTVLIGTPASIASKVRAENVAPIFLLPNIRNIYLKGLYLDRWRGGGWKWNEALLPRQSSSVAHLFIEEATPGPVKYAVTRFVASAKALRSFVVKNSDFDDFDIIVYNLAQEHGQTLETFIYIDEENGLRGFPCIKFMPRPGGVELDQLNAIRIFTINMSDVQLSALRRCTKDELHCGRINLRGFAKFFRQLANSVPKNVEVLIYRNSSGGWKKDEFEAIEAAFAELFEGEGYSDYPNLRTIYLDEVFVACDLCGLIAAEQCSKWLVQMGKQHGIEFIFDPGSTERYVTEVCNTLFD